MRNDIGGLKKVVTCEINPNKAVRSEIKPKKVTRREIAISCRVIQWVSTHKS